MIGRLWLSIGLAFSLTVAAPARAQSPTGAVDELRAEVRTQTNTYDPNRPIWVRFVLSNPSDKSIEVPLDAAPPGGEIALPLELILGPTDQAALHIRFQDERPEPVRAPPAPLAPQPTSSPDDRPPPVLRLAPHAALGADVDLRTLYRSVRYSGAYELEWRPLGGRLPVVRAEFRVEPRMDAILVTDLGKITLTLLYDKAPRNVENFLDLVRHGYYDGKLFHRVVSGFIAQGGCASGESNCVRSDGTLIAAEFSDVQFEPGTLAMARKPSDPNSASCQFFITLARAPDLDGRYTVIGQARDDESLRTLDKIGAVPTDKEDHPLSPVTIRSIKLVESGDGVAARDERTP